MCLRRTLTAHVDKLHRKKDKDENVKTYPVDDGGGARHLDLMLQRGRGWMHTGLAMISPCGHFAVQPGEVQGRTTGCRDSRCAARVSVCAADLVRANNHGVNRVENDGEQHPQNGREEEAANDFAYGMSSEETG